MFKKKSRTKQKRGQFLCLAKSTQLSTVCYLLNYVEDLAKVPWKPEVRVKQATKDYSELSTEMHEVC